MSVFAKWISSWAIIAWLATTVVILRCYAKIIACDNSLTLFELCEAGYTRTKHWSAEPDPEFCASLWVHYRNSSGTRCSRRWFDFWTCNTTGLVLQRVCSASTWFFHNFNAAVGFATIVRWYGACRRSSLARCTVRLRKFTSKMAQVPNSWNSYFKAFAATLSVLEHQLTTAGVQKPHWPPCTANTVDCCVTWETLIIS